MIYEGSSKLGGWIDTKKIDYKNEQVCFEKGPRTLRIATGELKELNSLQMANDLEMGSNVELIPATHIAAKNRYIYSNNKINAFSPSLFGKSEILSKRLASYLWKEFRTPGRNVDEVKDESLWSFIARRMDPEVADNLVDPLFKGICGGDIKKLSAATLVKNFYDYEATSGSIIRGALSRKKSETLQAAENTYKDLVDLRQHFRKQSVWRVRTGMSDMVDKLAKNVTKNGDVRILLNESVESLEFSNEKVKIKSTSCVNDVDFVISSVYSKYLADMLSEDYGQLKTLLSQIECVDMVLVNFFFEKNVLPIKGFGYLVPTKEKSPILGCIFDSVFNKPENDSTTLTAMLGGSWYNEYIGAKTPDQIYDMAFKEIRGHLGIKIDPDIKEVSILKNAIPQYRVGHQTLLQNINKSIVGSDLSDRLFLTGNTYDGIGVNDSIFNARKLVQEVLAKKLEK